MLQVSKLSKNILGFIGLSVGVLLSQNAVAAPQILGLVASLEPTKLQCHGGICFAEFSSYCMQEHRKRPANGTAYLPSKNTKLVLHIAGKQIAVESEAKYISARGYTSVQISLPESVLESHGHGAAALSIGPSGSLVPIAQAGDKNPLTPQEIALYTGSHRDHVERVSHNKNESVEAARLTSRMINALPKYQDATENKRQKLWENEIGQRARDVSPQAYRSARKAFNSCKGFFNLHGADGMRQCLELYHDKEMTDVTNNVWKELKPGT